MKIKPHEKQVGSHARSFFPPFKKLLIDNSMTGCQNISMELKEDIESAGSLAPWPQGIYVRGESVFSLVSFFLLIVNTTATPFFSTF